MNITIRHLRAFMALAELRNFTRAASSVFLSQPAFSALINGLETEIGFRLFDRDTRNVHLTPDGEAFKRIAIRNIRLYEDSKKEIKAIAHGEHGRVCVAALPSVAVTLLPSILPVFRKSYPNVRVELIDAPSDRCMQLLDDGIADFTLTTLRVDRDAFHSVKLFTETFHLICHKDHPLAAFDIISLSQLHGHLVLNFSRLTSIRQHLDHSLPENTTYDSLEVEQLTTMMGLIAAGLGVSIIPELALYQFRHPDMVIRPFSDLKVFRETHVIRLKDRTLSNAAENFYRQILAYDPAKIGQQPT
ncbi:LysR family transcriptional regulator [Microvirga sp. W0021]|uniref:LysR family transcriptional regulator n=1 Tax=Hohaiivirga grylli TaxID=3133970 RepID=A0ABV0BIC5_9HYPH